MGDALVLSNCSSPAGDLPRPHRGHRGRRFRAGPDPVHRPHGEGDSREADVPLAGLDVADTTNGDRSPYSADEASDPDVVVYRISGAFFFGAASTVSGNDRNADRHKAFILDCSAVPFLDSTAANADRRRGEEGEASRRALHHHRCFTAGAPDAVRASMCAPAAGVRLQGDTIARARQQLRRESVLTNRHRPWI